MLIANAAPEATITASVLVVIVNWRTAGLTIDCLRSVIPERERLPGLQVVVTDNASGDGSAERIAGFIADNDLGSWMTAMPLPRNGGFAYGNNEGMRARLQSSSPPDFVLLLNPDTIVRPHGILNLVAFLQANPKIGLAGSRLEDPDGTAQESAFRFLSIATEFDTNARIGLLGKLFGIKCVAPPIPDSNTQMDWVAGASMLIRREVLDQIGLLDDNYFMYYEEVEFCWRARKAGWPCWYVPSSRVVHLVGQASGVTAQTGTVKRRPDYWFNSRRRFFLSTRGPWYAAACDLASMTGLAICRLRWLVSPREHRDPPHLMFDMLRHSVLVRGFKA